MHPVTTFTNRPAASWRPKAERPRKGPLHRTLVVAADFAAGRTQARTGMRRLPRATNAAQPTSPAANSAIVAGSGTATVA